MIFPRDAQTNISIISGVENRIILTPASGSYNTILGVSMVQSGVQSNTELYCGSNLIARNYDKDLSFNPINFPCPNTIRINKTGMGDTSVTTFTYVPYNIASMSTTVEIIPPTFDSFYLFFGLYLFLNIFFAIIFYYRIKSWIAKL